MNKFTTLCLASLLGVSSLSVIAAPAEDKPAPAKPKLLDVAPYPEAAKNQVRYAIFLEPKDHEENYKVELVVGKNMQIDCNQHTLMGTINQETLKGWGYNYYTVKTDGETISTRMGCPQQEKKQAFVTLRPQQLERYNSKLPIVVYAPKGIDVRYRIWSASAESIAAEVE